MIESSRHSHIHNKEAFRWGNVTQPDSFTDTLYSTANKAQRQSPNWFEIGLLSCTILLEWDFGLLIKFEQLEKYIRVNGVYF